MFNITVFKTRLKQAREELKMSQAELAEKTGIPKANISYYENPKQTGLPNVEALNKIIEVLDVSYDYLIGNTTSKRADNIDIAEKLHFTDNTIRQIEERRIADDLINCRQLDISDALNIMLEDNNFCDEFFPNFYNYLNKDSCRAIARTVEKCGIATQNTDSGNLFLLGMVQALTELRQNIRLKVKE